MHSINTRFANALPGIDEPPAHERAQQTLSCPYSFLLAVRRSIPKLSTNQDRVVFLQVKCDIDDMVEAFFSNARASVKRSIPSAF